MDFENVKDLTTVQQVRDLNGVDQDKYTEIKTILANLQCSYIVQKSRSDTKTLLDISFTFGTDFILIEQNALTRVIIDPIKYVAIEGALFDNGDIMYGDWAEYHATKARLEA